MELSDVSSHCFEITKQNPAEEQPQRHRVHRAHREENTEESPEEPTRKQRKDAKAQSHEPDGTCVEPGHPRTSSALGRMKTISMNKFMSPVPLLPQHASRTPGLSPRPTPFGKDRTPPKPVRPLGRSPFPEGRRTERKARFPSRASIERHARSARADARYRPTTVLCVSASLCLCVNFLFGSETLWRLFGFPSSFWLRPGAALGSSVSPLCLCGESVLRLGR